MNIDRFSTSVKEKLKCYVYRLIDPRDGHTFYVGKGQGDRVFAHVKAALKASEEEDELSLKLKTIAEIHGADLEVIHVIHRHGMDEDTAYAVESALIDAYPGAANV